MRKSEIIDQVSGCTGGRLRKGDIEGVLDAAFAALGRNLRDDGRASWPGFGTFTVRERSARKGRNPQTGDAIDIAASRTVGFRPAPLLKEMLDGTSRT